MEKKTKLVLDLLRPRAVSLGFTKEELEGVAADIAGNLAVQDDVTEEVLNAAVTKAVDAVMPYLELSQKSANRIIQKNKEEKEKAEADAKKKAEAEAARVAAEKAEAERKAKEEADRLAREEADRKAAEEAGLTKFLESDWVKNMKAENEKLAKQLKQQQEASQKAQAEFAAFREEFNAMKADRVKADREKRLGELLEGSGIFGERIRKNYSKMAFDSDEDFNEFLSGVDEDIKAFKQERADKGLETLVTPSAGDKVEPGTVEPMTEAEIESLAAIM